MPQPIVETEENQPEVPMFALGFVFAMPIEAAGIVDKMTERKTTKGDGRTFHTGFFGKQRTAVIESGVGYEKAEKAAEVLLDVFAPKKVISAGYAGALNKRLKRYNVCFPELLLRKSDGAMLDVSASIPQQTELPLPVEGKLTLLTTDEVVSDPRHKLLYTNETGAELVDMETFAVAGVCRKRRVPFRAVRIILDTAEQRFPKDILQIIQNAEKGVIRLTGSVLGSVFRRPSSIFDLWLLKEQTLQASDRLAKHLAAELTERRF